ncbi:MAG: UDP-N-acetylglucosamine 2-epimerase (non-hydrolyzing) [Chromatiales bacterium]|jgi:UDP-N-acetylglucosamine 2-epimerase (non-hydrolysing)|nr:UDP-N-acetylglucosamine 2-epimerase (non-hydrolyzing) [Chromatiales bacterium]MDP6150127.1 UDP-N-acetylglucosamine 2-epimerase (non-hydrolyzing) [Gammaproteobacteria bacterium]MDP7271773.1 UDP-N-acetylglucosamine 2-epimerase (non-hydrolyzing) [Gammaproteobacteria bacterium]HJP05765.1 UDP-N-acetylglucosamine 2-epimerase (non-hydrolyzing) [Gammaproteobacteria bacterium]
MTDKVVVHLIAAARPNFMKVAPLYHALMANDNFDVRLVHTGQHYDANMSQAFFDDLGLPQPHHYLEVGSGTHAEQTGKVMMRYEETAMKERPDWTVVVGDVNSTAAVAMVCAKLLIPVAHLEAGLRSGDRSMPEEINRLVTDTIADLLWTPSPDADENLLKEGVAPARIELVGNIMIDSYELMRERIEATDTAVQLGVAGERFGVVTLHRPANVDARDSLELLTNQLLKASEQLKLVFPVHPRTRKSLENHGLLDSLLSSSRIHLAEPLSYIEFMSLVRGAVLAVTDSGGIQEETTYLDIPCLTLRPNTERPITVTQGSNRLIKPVELLDNIQTVLAGEWPASQCPDLWDGRTAQRCVESLEKYLNAASAA